MHRMQTRAVQVGPLTIGGDNRVVIQSMCSIRTNKVDEVYSACGRYSF